MPKPKNRATNISLDEVTGYVGGGRQQGSLQQQILLDEMRKPENKKGMTTGEIADLGIYSSVRTALNTMKILKKHGKVSKHKDFCRCGRSITVWKVKK